MQHQNFDQLEPHYAGLLDAMRVDAHELSVLDGVAHRIVGNKGTYATVSDKTSVPYAVIGVIHEREASGNFKCHLHNGDPLSARTVHVPAGRPVNGAPPFSWVSSAEDALALDHLTDVHDWTLEHACYMLEVYNGFGYWLYHHTNTPYLWAGSSNYKTGKYTVDGGYDPAATDRQLGAIPLLSRIALLDPAAAFPRFKQGGAVAPSQPAPAALPATPSLSAHSQAPHPDATPHPGSWGTMWKRATDYLAADASL